MRRIVSTLQHTHHRYFLCVCVGAAWLLHTAVPADILRDGTIGPDRSIQPAGPHFELPESLGERRGGNLFHSFAEFNLSQDQSATFTGTDGINTIITRITGPGASTIDGLLRAPISADLYLLNPHGIVFGPQAQLDVYGAFHASTADRLEFSNGEVFSAVIGDSPPVLSTAAPVQFGFLGPSAAPIELRGSHLESVYTVALEAGTIALNDGATITTATDRPDTGGDITLTAAEQVTLSGINSETGFGAGLNAGSQSNGNAGAIRIEAPVVELQDGARVSTDIAGTGNGGAVTITAAQRVTLAGQDRQGTRSGIYAQATGEGNAGLIRLDAATVELKDGAQISTTAQGAGSGGELRVTATERLSLSGKNQLGLGATLQAGTTGAGNGGTLHVTAPVVALQDSARLVTSTEGAGRGGDLIVEAQEQVLLSGTDDEGTGARLQANAQGTGDAGNIHVSAPQIALLDGAAMEVNTRGGSTGRGGALRVTATERVSLAGTDGNGFGSSLQAIANGTGEGGTVHVAAPVIELDDGAFLKANSAGSAVPAPSAPSLSGSTSYPDAALVVLADRRLTLAGTNADGQGSRLETTALEQSGGRELFIDAPVIQLADGAAISSASVGTGAAGAIQIQAEQSLELTGGSQITSSTQSTSGGDITVKSGGLLHLSGSTISTDVGSGRGKGGDINITQQVLVLDRSDITARADRGEGGGIQITADAIFQSSDSLISAAAGPEGTDGKVVTHAPQTDLTREIARPPAAFLDASALLRPRCDAAGPSGATGSFRVARQQGLPLSPEDLLMAFDTVTIPPRPAGSVKTDASGDPVALAAAAFHTGHFEQAGEYWAQASAHAPNDAHAQNAALRGVAESQQVQGNYQASLATLQRALVAVETVEDDAGIAATQGQIGNAYLALGEAEQAQRWLREAIARAQAANDAVLLATLYNNLGNHDAVQQHYAEALQAYEASAQYAPETEQRATAWSNGARAALELGQAERAAALLDQARAAAQTLTAGYTKIAVLIHLAKSAERIGEAVPATKRRYFAAAYTDLREAAQLSREADDLRRLSYALGNLGRLYQHERRYAEALYLTRLAEQAAEQARAPEALYRWHWQSGQLLWAQGEGEAALQAYRRAVALLEDSRQETLAQYGAASQRFRYQVAPVYEEFADVLLQRAARFGDGEQSAPLRLEARATVEQLKAAELRDYFRDECVTELEAKTARLETVSPRAAVIYPIVLPQRLELLVTLPTGLKQYTVPVEAAVLTVAIQRFRERVETRASEARVRQAGRALYTWLIEPFAADLGEVDTLVFVPGGPLRTVPLGALYDGENYLIQRYRVAVTPGLALTDPRPFNRRGAKVVLAGLSQSVQQFPALPAVSQELQEVRQIFGGRILLDQDFTTTRFQQSLDQPVSVVHIASHAQFTGEAASSFLLTYDGRLSMDDLNRYLSVTRFREQPLELLVLSACQTAAGDERAALGLAGVGIKAGARSAVGSLWDIDDEATAAMMTAFYQELSLPDATKAQALQAAQQQIAQSARFSHPYYWSPYLLVNNWL